MLLYIYIERSRNGNNQVGVIVYGCRGPWSRNQLRFFHINRQRLHDSNDIIAVILMNETSNRIAVSDQPFFVVVFIQQCDSRPAAAVQED